MKNSVRSTLKKLDLYISIEKEMNKLKRKVYEYYCLACEIQKTNETMAETNKKLQENNAALREENNLIRSQKGMNRVYF